MKIEGTFGGQKVGDDHDPLLVGVINLSPESFYKGSVADGKSVLEAKIQQMYDYNVGIIDVGAISSRPINIYGGKEEGIKKELKRTNELLPPLIELAENYNLPVAMDTQNAMVAERAIELGCDIINDISGLKNDPKMAEVIASTGKEVVLMATNQKAGDPCGMKKTITALTESIEIANNHGIARSQMVIDPAFGGWQGKKSTCDIELLKNFHDLSNLELPIYIGVSRKSTINTLGGGELPEDRLVGSIILTQWLIDRGAHIIRTHDVKETTLGLRVARSLSDFT